MAAPIAAPGLIRGNRAARSLPMSGGGALALGGCLTLFVAAMGAGVVMMLVTGRASTLAWIYLALPVAGLTLTLGLAGHGARTLLRQAQARKRAALHPGEPWHTDWEWDPAGAVEERSWGAGSIRFLFFAVVMAAAFTALFFFAALPSQELPGVVKGFFALIVGIWDLVLLQAVYQGLKDLAVRVRTGPARLHFGTFPFFLGQPLEARLSANALEGRDDVVVTLRCLEERFVERRRYGRGGSLSIGVFQLHEVRQPIEGRVERDAGVTVALATPDGDLATCLRRHPPRYWELEVEAKGADPIRFLVPVYSDSRGSSART